MWKLVTIYYASCAAYTFSALCVLLQADEYSWSDRPQALSPTRQSSSKHLQIDKEAGSVTKERLYYKAIELFSNGKYWELGMADIHTVFVTDIHSHLSAA
jgi:hypothetical protein